VQMELDRNLTLLRPAAADRPIISLDEACEMEFVSEADVNAFQNGATEHCILPVRRTPAILLTPSCDLSEDYWLFSPLRAVVDQPKMNRGTLHSTTKGYGDMFGIYAHPQQLFDESYTSFHDIFSVPSEPFRIFSTSRIANLSKESQSFLEDKLARFLSRGWGYAPHEKVETSGFYRCRLCFKYYGLPDTTIHLEAGTNPPTCKNCAATKQQGSWELLVKHKRSKKLNPANLTPVPSRFTRLLRFLKLTRANM
jgi:hypothetical protein